MKAIVAHVLVLCIAILTKASPVQSSNLQVLLPGSNGNIMASAINDKVPGHSDATYSSLVPKEKQILKVEFLDIAPTPILAYALLFLSKFSVLILSIMLTSDQ